MNTHFKPETLQYITDLKNNNDRNWFQENKERYDLARQDFLLFVGEWIKGVAAFDESVTDQKASEIVFRIYRDVRFSNDKRPYKDHFGAYLAPGGRKSVYPGYYFHFSSGNQSFIGGGLWMPPAPHLKAVRQEIDYNFQEFSEIVHSPEFTKSFGQELAGEKLKSSPKGYDATNPALDYLKYKSWVATHSLTDEQLLQPDLLKNCLGIAKALMPLKDFLLRPMLEISSDSERG
ncbi:DUF2461 domain-containing protein [Adhaeribacter radiodurans]|uniref:DUF2461 domain-containing protein n=1 Tax=Adhaeribacter radiodurans TaxID=2745197 RepID=A0A7L7L7K8_9BACT|nr:DUF2461 domain-containing protein [Adhaeribacter radiodurans]QMU28821.1 DUF2461 domain-containing protein [Adhaeribacter radiodurans]